MQVKENKLSLGVKIGYAAGASGYVLIQTMFASFTMVFYTTVFGISPAVVGTMMLVARVWDAINDPMMGAIIDKTHTKWGKAKPYIIGGTLPLGIFLVLTFTAPDLSNTGKIIWAYIGYIGLGMTMTVVQTSMFTLMPRLSKNPQDMISLNTWYMFGSHASAVVIGLVITPMLMYFANGGVDMKRGYQITAIIFAVVAVVFLWLLGFSAEEIQETSTQVKNKEKITIKQMALAVVKNDQLLLLCVVGLTGGICAGISQGSNVMYIFNNLKDPNILTLTMPTAAIASIAGTMVTPWATKKIGKQKALYISIIFGAIFIGARIITKDQNITQMIIFNALAMFGMAFYSVFFVPMLTDAIEYGEWKTGNRLEGVIMAAYTFQGKFGLGVGGAIIGFALEAGGFDSNASQQVPSALNVLFHGAVTSQFVSFASLFVLLFFFYKLDDKKMAEIRKDLSEGKYYQPNTVLNN